MQMLFFVHTYFVLVTYDTYVPNVFCAYFYLVVTTG